LAAAARAALEAQVILAAFPDQDPADGGALRTPWAADRLDGERARHGPEEAGRGQIAAREIPPIRRPDFQRFLHRERAVAARILPGPIRLQALGGRLAPRRAVEAQVAERAALAGARLGRLQVPADARPAAALGTLRAPAPAEGAELGCI